MASTEVNSVDHRAPNVRHLVYSMYRKMLDEYNDQANEIVDSLPRDVVQEDADIYRHLQEIIKQQHQPVTSVGPAGDGPQPSPIPPPPPPPAFPGAISGRRLKTEIPERGLEPPPAIQNAMMTKDKKPFTYTPGGLDLSEIRSPKMQRRINRNACSEEMTGRPAPTANEPAPTGPPPPTPYSALQSQLPTSVLPARGIAPPPPPPPPPDSLPPPPPPPPLPPSPSPAAPQAQSPKPPAFHKPQQMGFDPNEILARAGRNQNQETAPKKDARPNFKAEPPRKAEEEPQSMQAKPQNEPGQLYVPPVIPKPHNETAPSATVVNHSPRAQVGSIFVPPASSAVQEQHTPSPTSPYKVQSSSPTVSPISPPAGADVKQQAPWVTVDRAPQVTPPSWMISRQSESPKPHNTRIIPIQIEGRDSSQPEPKQQNRPHTRVIPIQIEGAPQPAQGYQNKFNPMTPQSPTPYTPPTMDSREQRPQWAPVQAAPFAESQFGQQRMQNETRAQTQPEYGNYNSAGVPLNQLRKLQLNEDDRALMDKFKSQIEKHGNDAITDENANPRYRGSHIPSRVFKMLDESVDDETYLHQESDPRYRGAAIPSRAFRLLQNMTNTAGEMPQQVPKSPVRGYVSRSIPVAQEPPSGPYIPASEQQVQEPRKYTGSSIPSRSFRMLQAMTGQEVTARNQAKANSSSGRKTPVPGMGRWCPSPILPSVDPYWYLYHSDPFFMYKYISELNAVYGYPPPQPFSPSRCTPTPASHSSYMSDSDEQGYSSTDELGQYYANYINRMAYSPFVMSPDSYYQKDGVDDCGRSSYNAPRILITPEPRGCRGARSERPAQILSSAEAKNRVEREFMGTAKAVGKEDSLMESESSSEEETESDTDDDQDDEGGNAIGRKACKAGTLQTLKSVSDVGIYASESATTITNEEDWEDKCQEPVGEDEEEESTSESVSGGPQENLPHQLSVIFEESEHSDVDNLRQKEGSATKSVTSESEGSNADNGTDESDDELDTESSVTVRLPLRLRFTRGLNDEDVATVIVGDSEVRKSKRDQEERQEKEDANVSITFSLPARSGSVVSVVERDDGDAPEANNRNTSDPEEVTRKEESNAEVTVSLSLPLRKKSIPKLQEEEKNRSDGLSYDSKTEESDSTHCEDDSSSTSADTVVKHRADTDEDDNEKPDKVNSGIEDFRSRPDRDNGKDWNEKTAPEIGGDGQEGDISYETGAERLEKMISSMLEKTKETLEQAKVMKESSLEESEDDSGVTSDMSAKQVPSETDTESDFSELSKMTQCQRASTHSRLFKLLQEECGIEEVVEDEKAKTPETLSLMKNRLTLPLSTSSEVESLSSSSGVTSPSSPTVTERLVRELVQSLLNKKKGRKFRKLPLAKLHAAALRILQEDMDPYDTSSNSASGDDGFLSSPVQKVSHSSGSAEGNGEALPDVAYGDNYYDYLDYYNTWGNAGACCREAERDIVPSKAFRMLALQPNAMDGLGVKCPRVPVCGAVEKCERKTPSAATCHRLEDPEDCAMTFADKQEKIAKIFQNPGK